MSNNHLVASSRAGRPQRLQKHEASHEKTSLKNKGNIRWKAFTETVRKVHRPSLKEWRREWKWVLIVVGGSILTILGVDWLSLMGRDALTDILPVMGGGLGENIFLIVYIICGLLALGSILFLKGASGGLSSLLGSSVEVGARSSAGFENTVTRFMVTMSITFVLMTLLSPLFLS